jgi:polysaccharide biosynthesis/export protein
MLTLLLIALGCAQSPPPPPPAAPESGPAGAVGREYRIGPGDILRVTVYGHDDLGQTVVVQPGGGIVFPLIGTVPAADETPQAVEARIAKRLAKGLIRDPQVSVVVQEYRSKVVYVVGEVSRPGTYPLAGDTSVVEILARAGPLSPAAGSEVVVVRPGATPAEVLRVNVRDLQAGRLERNVALRPNDTVFVPQAARIFVSGEVRNPGAFAYSAGLTVRQAVALAGGFTEDASKSAKVVREVGGQPRTIKVRLDDPVAPGDTVVVKAKLF